MKTEKKQTFLQTSVFVLTLAVLLGLLVFSIMAAITFGNADISIKQVYSVIIYELFHLQAFEEFSTGAIHDVVWLIRMPRVILGLCVGMGLAVCGVVMQAIVKNPLADPYVLGISSGASLGATVAIILGIGSVFGGNFVGIMAFAGALAATSTSGPGICLKSEAINLAVIDENRVARMAIARQTLERGGGDVLVALDVVGGDDEFLTLGQLDLVFAFGVLLEPTAADLWTLQVNQRSDVAAGRLGSRTHVVVDLEVILRGAVRAVETRDVHTGFDELGDAFEGLGGWTDRVDDLCFTHEYLPLFQLVFYRTGENPVSMG